MKVKEESEKPGLKYNIQKTKIMASSPIISWQLDWETIETERLYSQTPKLLQMITATLKLKKKNKKTKKPTKQRAEWKC